MGPLQGLCTGLGLTPGVWPRPAHPGGAGASARRRARADPAADLVAVRRLSAGGAGCRQLWSLGWRAGRVGPPPTPAPFVLPGRRGAERATMTLAVTVSMILVAGAVKDHWPDRADEWTVTTGQPAAA